MKDIVFKTKLDPITDNLLDNRILNVFELYLSELLKKRSRQLFHKALVQFCLRSKSYLQQRIKLSSYLIEILSNGHQEKLAKTSLRKVYN